MQEMTLLSREPLCFGLAGEIDAGNCDEFYGEVLKSYRSGDLVFECAKLEFIDSTMLGTLVKLRKTVAEQGGSLILRHLQSRLKKLFVICALDKVMEIEE